MITFALAKGRTLNDVLPLWQRAGLPVPPDLEDSRALVFSAENAAFGMVRLLLAKPADVPTYVSFGVADLGIVGEDVILEAGREVYELLDLDTARCTLCVAGRPELRPSVPRRVATKYPRLADDYFRRRGQAVEIVELGGSIELAAVIGLADRIFDLVQTGGTLAANGLAVFDRVLPVSARLIANRASYRSRRSEIDRVTEHLQRAIQKGDGRDG
ncbi:MAG: ATP phosphoribosyltransferase [Alicyclobacillus sp.]|nr:ATP phosphoribosyltransferase [Alicyclobacillus sp.]